MCHQKHADRKPESTIERKQALGMLIMATAQDQEEEHPRRFSFEGIDYSCAVSRARFEELAWTTCVIPWASWRSACETKVRVKEHV